MFAIAWYGFLMLLGLVILPFIIKKRGSAMQRLVRIAAGFMVWVLLVFSDELLEDALLHIACNWLEVGAPEKPDPNNPLPLVHIGMLDGDDCGAVCQRGLYEIGIQSITAYRKTASDDAGNAPDRELVRFWLEPCMTDKRGACVRSEMVIDESKIWQVLQGMSEPVVDFGDLFPIKLRMRKTTWSPAEGGFVVESQTYWSARVSLFSYPLDQVYPAWSHCSSPMHYSYPDLQKE